MGIMTFILFGITFIVGLAWVTNPKSATYVNRPSSNYDDQYETEAFDYDMILSQDQTAYEKRNRKYRITFWSLLAVTIISGTIAFFMG